VDIIPKTILNKLPEYWKEIDNSLQREYIFLTFEEAIRFMHDCVSSIDALNHHPEWSNVYNRVKVILRTHDAGDSVTDKDYKLAEILESIYLK